MTDHLAHLQHPTVLAASAAWQAHFDSCEQCQAAPGPPPPDCPPEQRDLYACEVGMQLHDKTVLAAQDAYQAANPRAFAPEPDDG